MGGCRPVGIAASRNITKSLHCHSFDVAIQFQLLTPALSDPPQHMSHPESILFHAKKLTKKAAVLLTLNEPTTSATGLFQGLPTQLRKRSERCLIYWRLKRLGHIRPLKNRTNEDRCQWPASVYVVNDSDSQPVWRASLGMREHTKGGGGRAYPRENII